MIRYGSDFVNHQLIATGTLAGYQMSVSNTKLLSGFLATLQQITSEAVATPRQ
jgi:hypothetical protein